MKLFTSNKTIKADVYSVLQKEADAAAAKEIKSLFSNFECDFGPDTSRIKFENHGGYVEVYCKDYKRGAHLNVGYNGDLTDTDANLISGTLAAVVKNGNKVEDILKRHAEFRYNVWDGDLSEADAKSLLFKLFRV